jgi:hypothetical protein
MCWRHFYFDVNCSKSTLFKVTGRIEKKNNYQNKLYYNYNNWYKLAGSQRKYGVSEKVIRGWRKQKETLRMTKKSRKAFRVHAPHWPALEDQLEEFVLEQRADLLLYKGTE